MGNKVVDSLYDSKTCTGCMACVNVCSKSVLAQGVDDEGFIKPTIARYEDCINCGMCVNVCQIHHLYTNKSYNTACRSFIVQGVHKRPLKLSSSGGVFYETARLIIEYYQGVVVGAAFNDSLEVVHTIVDNVKDLRLLQGSKYVQSNTGTIFYNVKRLLEARKYVLFSGTPCQIYGLKLFLRKEYQKLITIDIICHGITSPKLLKHHIEAVETKYRRKVKQIRFRWKNPLFASGSSFYMMMMMENAPKYLRIGKNDAYMNLYLSGNAFRECCYDCRFANLNRVGDITAGDCDSHLCYPDFHPDDSNSTLILNSDKALRLWEDKLSQLFDYYALDLKREAGYNKQLKAPTPRSEERTNIYTSIDALSTEEYLTKYGKVISSFHVLASKIIIYLPKWAYKLLSIIRK